jgi:hypothetical protein
MTLQSHFSDPYPNNTFGVITGTFNVSRFPNIPGKLFALKARSSNANSMFIGDARSTGTLRLPWEIQPGETIGWFSANNLNELYMAGNSGSLYMGFWVQG